MPDILASTSDSYEKTPSVTFTALTPHGHLVLSEARGSRCSGFVIRKGRLKKAKAWLERKGCVIEWDRPHNDI